MLNILVRFFFAYILSWLPIIFCGAILLVAIFNCSFPNRKYLLVIKKLTTKRLIYALIFGTLFFDLLLTATQYLVWQQGGISRFFLPPYQSINYFLGYVYLHFFAANILAMASAFILYFIFKIITKYRSDIISRAEMNLFLLAGLLVSWPKVVILVPLFLFLALISSAFNLVIRKRQNTGLSWPIILSAIIIFIFGTYLIKILSLTVLTL